MKKYKVIILVLAGMALFTIISCNKDDDSSSNNNNNVVTDVVPPVITLNGESIVEIVQYDTANYVDPGASAVDQVSGVRPVTKSGSYDANLAGTYTILYKAYDAIGNMAQTTRTIIVSGADYIAGSYWVTDYVNGDMMGSYIETIISSSLVNNQISFSKFAFYSNANVYGTISDSTITIPSQTVTCGYPEADRTFSGSGTYNRHTGTFTIDYTETTNSVSVNGYGEYSKN